MVIFFFILFASEGIYIYIYILKTKLRENQIRI